MTADTKALLESLRQEKEKIVGLSQTEKTPVNLVHLRSFTGGNIEQEKMLFDLFETTAEQCISELQRYLEDSSDNWRNSAHRLKGAAANLGAEHLASVCQHAEKLDDTLEKEASFKDIEAATNDVMVQLRALIK